MFRLVIVSCLLALSWGALIPTKGKKPLRDLAPNFPSSRIIGGQDTRIETAPYQVAIERSDTGFQYCGGSVLNETAILTAAYCLYEKEPEDIVVRYGSSYHEAGGSIAEAKEFIRHSKWDLITIDYDAAIIILKTPLTFNDQTQPIIPADDEPTAFSGVRITGWGRIHEHGETPIFLQSVVVPIANRTVCEDIYASYIPITARMICGGVFGMDACEGDKGGPVVYEGKLVGIVSWSYGCAREGYPGVYTNVANEEIRDFIREIVGV